MVCLVSCWAVAKALLQAAHTWFFSPVCVRMWVCKWPPFMKRLSHRWHTYGRSPVWMRMWCIKPGFVRKILPQVSHWCCLKGFCFFSVLVVLGLTVIKAMSSILRSISFGLRSENSIFRFEKAVLSIMVGVERLTFSRVCNCGCSSLWTFWVCMTSKWPLSFICVPPSFVNPTKLTYASKININKLNGLKLLTAHNMNS